MSWKLITPALCISLTHFLLSSECDTLSRSGLNVPFRPPGWVFAVVWPILYITMGVGWMHSSRNVNYAGVILGCCSWLYVYSCMKDRIISSYVLFFTTILAWSLFAGGSIWDLPLALWLSFATYLNIYDIR